MSYSSDSFIDTQEKIVDDYVMGERLPEDFETAVRNLVWLGFDQIEAVTLIQEACL